MKIKGIIMLAAAMAMTTGVFSSEADAQYNNSNPGIAVAGSADVSQLPEKAKAFLKKHFKNVGARTCEKYFAKGKYEVELVNGIDLEFNTDGEIIEIDAPDNTILATSVVKDILPRKAYERLNKDGVAAMVESIEFDKGKVYKVDLNIPEPDTYIFDPAGLFIVLED